MFVYNVNKYLLDDIIPYTTYKQYGSFSEVTISWTKKFVVNCISHAILQCYNVVIPQDYVVIML